MTLKQYIDIQTVDYDDLESIFLIMVEWGVKDYEASNYQKHIADYLLNYINDGNIDLDDYDIEYDKMSEFLYTDKVKGESDLSKYNNAYEDMTYDIPTSDDWHCISTNWTYENISDYEDLEIIDEDDGIRIGYTANHDATLLISDNRYYSDDTLDVHVILGDDIKTCEEAREYLNSIEPSYSDY